MDLNNNELDVLAKYIGHDIVTHRKFYRLPSETMDLAKVSKLLLQMEKGEDGIACLRSKNLDDIEINEMDGKSKDKIDQY
jgi:hypothetical protein